MEENIKTITLRLTEELHYKLKIKAAKESITLQDLLSKYVGEYVKDERMDIQRQ